MHGRRNLWDIQLRTCQTLTNPTIRWALYDTSGRWKVGCSMCNNLSQFQRLAAWQAHATRKLSWILERIFPQRTTAPFSTYLHDSWSKIFYIHGHSFYLHIRMSMTFSVEEAEHLGYMRFVLCGYSMIIISPAILEQSWQLSSHAKDKLTSWQWPSKMEWPFICDILKLYHWA
jgi:hypothetical protein